MHTSRWWVALAVVTIHGAALRAQEEDVYESMLRGGQDKLARGQWSSAQAEFDELLAACEEEAEADRPKPWIVLEARLGLLELQLGQGEYEAVAEALRKLPAADRANTQAVVLLAEALARVGDYSGAAAALAGSLQAAPTDARLRFLAAEVAWADGKRERAKAGWQALAEDATLTAPTDATYRARAMFRLGGRTNLETASRLLVEVLAKERPPALARITLGELKFAAYGEAAGFPSGESDLKKALEAHGDVELALLAMYRIRSSNMLLDVGRTEEYLDRVLERNPNCVEAVVLRAANVLDDRRFHEAARMFDAALAINPNDRTALAHRAAAAFLLHRSDEYDRLRARALEGDAGWPEPDRILGDHLAALYRFADAAEKYRAALAAAPDDVPSLHGLAKALVYTGRGAEAKELLLKAKSLQPGYVQPWRNNVIAVQDLLEKEYTLVADDRFAVRVHRDDAEVLTAYLLPILLEAHETLGRKYSYVPPEPVAIEALHTWDDFSVRTIGFRGFTALGACFGKLITLVSPRDGDLRKQDFMWEATAWHEYAHVLTLGVSKNRVPRWLTEGFSVYEERQRDPSWERGMDRELLDAYHNQDIPPVRLLNRLFRGPRILFGYYQGGLLVDLIATRYGFDKALALLEAYGEDLDLEEAFDRALGVPSSRIDAELLESIRTERLKDMRVVPRWDAAAVRRMVSRAAQDKSNLQVRVDLAWACLQQENPVDAGRWLAEVLRASPDHAGAHLVRAELLRRRGDVSGAMEAWRKGFAGGADDFDSRIACGDELRKAEESAAAIEMYEAAKRCWPRCTETSSAPELRLARLYRDLGDRDKAQAEMKAYCARTARAFTPRYTLAEFEREAGNRREELRYLIECNRIDPFFRQLHVRMGEAYEALDRPAEAAREFEVAAAVLPELDRRPAGEVEPEVELAERAGLWLRVAELRNRLGDRERAEALVRRILEQAPATDAAAGAKALQEVWRAK